MKVQKRGKNLMGGLPLAQAIYAVANKNKAKIDTENHTIKFEMSIVQEDGSYNGIIFANFKPNTQYTFVLMASQKTAGANSSLRVIYSDRSQMAITINGTDKIPYILTTPVGKTIKDFELNFYATNPTILYYDECGIFEGSISATDYEPYTCETLNISFPAEAGTVYGGTLDVLTGMLTVDRTMVDLGTPNWKSEETYASGQFRAARTEIMSLSPKYSSVQCSILNGVTPRGYSQFKNGEIGLSNGSEPLILRVRSEAFIGKTGEEIKTIMQGQQLVYELATPITYQLTPNEVKSLLGQNNIFADTGDTAVTYRADIQRYIDKKLSTQSTVSLTRSVPVQTEETDTELSE